MSNIETVHCPWSSQNNHQDRWLDIPIMRLHVGVDAWRKGFTPERSFLWLHEAEFIKGQILRVKKSSANGHAGDHCCDDRCSPIGRRLLSVDVYADPGEKIVEEHRSIEQTIASDRRTQA